MEEYYKVLGLKIGDSIEDVERRYNDLLIEFDPEKQEDDLKDFFKQDQDRVKEAYSKILESFIEETPEEINNEETEDISEHDTSHMYDEQHNDTDNLGVTHIGREGLDKMVYWAKFLAVLGYIIFWIMVIFSIVFLISYLNESSYSYSYRKQEYLSLFFMSGAFSLLFYFPSRYLYRFAIITRKALDHHNKYDLEKGLQNLGSNFKFVGVAMIIYLIILLFSILGTF